MLFSSLKERNEFIENNLGLVKSRVLKLNNNKFDDDLYQVGSLALVISTDRFDKSKGNEFSTYAVKYIDGYILKHKKYDSLIKPLRINNKTWNFLYKEVVSINERIGDGQLLINDIICNDDDVEKIVLDKIAVNEFLKSLPNRDRIIIGLIINGVNQSKISQMVRINQSNVSRIVSRGANQYINRYAV